MQGRLIILPVVLVLALAGLFAPGAATGDTAARKCGPGTTNPYCEKPPPCRDHRCEHLASNLIVSYSTRR